MGPHRTFGLVISLLVALAVTLPGLADADAQITCGAVLGPGGHYKLDRDLTCPETPISPDSSYSDRIGMLKVVDATLNLNGHTVTCSSSSLPNGGRYPSPTWGIVVRNSTLKNGTIRGCGYGIVTSRSVIRNMVLDGNGLGISLHEKYGAGHNLIIGNVMKNGFRGVYVQESLGEVLIDNVAEDNSEIGFA